MKDNKYFIKKLAGTAVIMLLPVFLVFNNILAQQFVKTVSSNIGEIETDYLSRKIVVKAFGASGEEQNSIAARKMWALTEARKNCITLAALAAGEVYAEGTTLLEAGRLKNRNFLMSISNYVKGIENISESDETLSDGSVLATVTMQINFDGNTGLNRLLFKSLFDDEKKPFLKPYQKAAVRPNTERVTGIVMDTRGLSVEPSISPRIYDVTGRLIYGPDHVTRAYAFRTGIIGYTKDMKNVSDRIGVNPESIKVMGVIENDASSLLISREEADRILALEESFGLMSECRVVFWIK